MKKASYKFTAGPANAFKPITEYSQVNGMPSAVTRMLQREIATDQKPSKNYEPGLNDGTPATLSEIPLKTMITRIFVDSRNRNLAVYSSANHFMISLPVPIRNVTSISLAAFSTPNIGNHKWVCVAIKVPGAEGVVQDKFTGQFPAGSLGVVPLLSGSAYTDYGSGVYNDPLKLDMTSGISLQEVEIFIYAFGGPQQQPILYPLADEVPPPPDLDISQNWYGTFIVEYKGSWGVAI